MLSAFLRTTLISNLFLFFQFFKVYIWVYMPYERWGARGWKKLTKNFFLNLKSCAKMRWALSLQTLWDSVSIICILKLFKTVCVHTLSISRKFHFFHPRRFFKVYVIICHIPIYTHIYLKNSSWCEKIEIFEKLTN
jgi:hypothetical protein